MPQELVTPAREGKFKFKWWRQASSKQNIARAFDSAFVFIHLAPLSSIFYISAMIHLYVHPIIKSSLSSGRKRGIPKVSRLSTFLCTYVQYYQHLPPKDFEETWEAPHLQDRVFLEVISSKARRHNLGDCLFSSEKIWKIQAPDGNWKLWVNLSAMLFRLKGDRLSWQERLGANGIDNVQYKQNMGPVPRPKSCKDGSRT